MIIINHRCNTIDQLKKTPNNFGIEVDIRTFGKKLTLHHEPFVKGEDFSKWIEYFEHKFLILNVKEEGLEKEVLKIIKKNKVKNFFFLDQSFPFIVKTLKRNEKRCALRVSDYESFETALNLKEKPDWIWLDCFEKLPLNPIKIHLLKKNHYKICIVSPELHNPIRLKEIKPLIRKISKLNINFDAVCTKKPLLWQS